jgi:hypothetical protein
MQFSNKPIPLYICPWSKPAGNLPEVLNIGLTFYNVYDEIALIPLFV